MGVSRDTDPPRQLSLIIEWEVALLGDLIGPNTVNTTNDQSGQVLLDLEEDYTR